MKPFLLLTAVLILAIFIDNLGIVPSLIRTLP